MGGPSSESNGKNTGAVLSAIGLLSEILHIYYTEMLADPDEDQVNIGCRNPLRGPLECDHHRTVTVGLRLRLRLRQMQMQRQMHQAWAIGHGP